MKSYKKLFNNVVIFALGNLGSKIISFILVPLYTHYLTQGEYGTADLVLTTTSMLIPIVSAAMYEAVIRFAIDRKDSRNDVLTNSIFISLIGYFILILFYPLINWLNLFGEYLIYLYIILFLQMINRILAQYTRGIGESKKFALNGIIISFATGTSNIIFLVGFEFGLIGYFWSYIIAYSLATIYLVIFVKQIRRINISSISKEVGNSLLGYSMPLIPNSLMWWLINGSSRYFIRAFVGIAANGVFAVSSRIPALINLVSQIFSQAWQLSAFEEVGEGGNSSFYTRIYELYSSVLFIVTSAFIVIMKPLFALVFSADFFSAWQPAPFLLLGTVFSALSGFVGVAYTATKKTKGVFKTSVYGGISSLVLNLLFIPTFGIIGAGFSSMISFFIMFIIRYFDTKDLVLLEINWKKFINTVLLILAQALILFLNLNSVTEIVSTLVLFLILLMINREVFSVLPFLWDSVKGIFVKKEQDVR